MSVFDNFTKRELEEAIHKYDTWREILISLGVKDTHNKMVPTLKQKLKELNIDFSFLDSTPLTRRNGYHNRNKYIMFSDEEVFKRDTKVSKNTVRNRLKEHTEIEYKCAICHMEPFWNGQPLVLTMDHIDGDTRNNELSNLRWVCPNCDRQLPTYAGKNKNNRKIDLHKKSKLRPHKNLCPICGEEKEKRAKYCVNCFNDFKRIYIKGDKKNNFKPSREVLKQDIRTMPILQIGKKYNVSSTAICKWCKMYGLPYKVSEIKQISDKVWKQI